MLRVALRMLFGDRTKYLTLVLSLAFAALLMNQQGAIFMGLLTQATGPLQNIHQPDLWVTDPSTHWVVEYRGLSEQKLGRVRSVPGVEWAEPLVSNWAVVELNTGAFAKVHIIGIPRTTLAGRPPEIIEGRLEDLWIPDAILVEDRSRRKLGYPKVGDTLRINDHRAIVVGFCRAKRGFESNAIIYSTLESALAYTPLTRNRISFILVKAKPGADLATVQAGINAVKDVMAYTPDEFRLVTIKFIMASTGIGVNFSITIVLGFLVGLFLSASVFYQFTVEQIRHFAVLKALGSTTGTLVAMVLVQATVVGVIGYGMGVGLAGIFTIASHEIKSDLAAIFPWQLMVGSFGATLLTIMLGSLLSIRRVVRVEPALVFSS